MNSSRKIEISKASLVSLKAELSRKQDEVNKAKTQGTYIHPAPRPKKLTIWTKQNAGVSERDEKDVQQEQEDEDVLKKSRAVLEAKSQLYNKLSQGASGYENKFLVDFEQKANEEEEEEKVSEEYDDPSDPEEDWVDYMDCLGRTRRCLKTDLAYIKEKDADLFKSLGGDEEEKEAEAEPAAPELQSADMRRETLRQKWEQQEEELRKKTDIHYQDVLFDEARSHGVGYYGFSQEEALRRSQQDALQKLRQQTQREQEATKDVKERRRLQLEARIKAAKRRQRERLGLPPEEEKQEPEVIELAEEEEEEEEEIKAPEEPELKPKPKPTLVRPWDIGKEGVKEVMSQEEWVQKKRIERPKEFAPPSTYQPDFMPTLEQEAARPKPTLFFSSKKQTSSSFQPTPIEDEIGPPVSFAKKYSDSSLHKEQGSPSSGTAGYEERRGQGAEIAPPPTFDYYGPSSSAPKRKATGECDLESSISAGLKYLRQQAEEKERKKGRGLLDIV